MTASNSANLIHFEDIAVGIPMRLGPTVVSRDDIINFARRYDPQPMHLDEEAAKHSIVGGLCAAGVHSCCIMMRLLCDHWVNRTASLGAPGIPYMKWLKPVRPGDTLELEAVFTSKRVMETRPSVGIAHVTYRMLNQDGEAVLESACPQMLRVRNPGAPVSRVPTASKPAVGTPLNLFERPVHTQNPTNYYFEDRHVGDVWETGSHTFGAAEIIDFARQFDPQPFHLDEEAGRKSLFGGLSASGWHTLAHFIRLFVADRQKLEARMRATGQAIPAYGPSPGFEDLKWLKPVMAGDTITCRAMIAEKVDLKSRPTRGLIKSRSQARNQKGEIVFDYTSMIMAERRTPWQPA